MQMYAAVRIPLRESVFYITGNGTTHGRKLSANLMGPSGERLYFQ